MLSLRLLYILHQGSAHRNKDIEVWTVQQSVWNSTNCNFDLCCSLDDCLAGRRIGYRLSNQPKRYCTRNKWNTRYDRSGSLRRTDQWTRQFWRRVWMVRLICCTVGYKYCKMEQTVDQFDYLFTCLATFLCSKQFRLDQRFSLFAANEFGIWRCLTDQVDIMSGHLVIELIASPLSTFEIQQSTG